MIDYELLATKLPFVIVYCTFRTLLEYKTVLFHFHVISKTSSFLLQVIIFFFHESIKKVKISSKDRISQLHKNAIVKNDRLKLNPHGFFSDLLIHEITFLR